MCVTATASAMLIDTFSDTYTLKRGMNNLLVRVLHTRTCVESPEKCGERTQNYQKINIAENLHPNNRRGKQESQPTPEKKVHRKHFTSAR